MKLKHVVASVALSFAMGFGALAGLMASKEARAAKADDPKTWMSMFTVDMSDIVTNGDMDSIENVRVHVWGTNINQTIGMHISGEENIYTVMASFTDGQAITAGQFIFDQIGGQYPGTDKYSADITMNLSNVAESPDVFCSSVNIWSDSKWAVTGPEYYKAYSWVAGVKKEYDRDPVNCKMSLKELELAASTVVESRVICGTTSNYTSGILTVSSNSHLSDIAKHYFTIAEAGTYDFLINNSYYDGGIFDIKKRGVEVSYIYYVTQSSEESPDFIYSFGYNENFGSWPGKRISKLDTVTAYFSDSLDFKYHGSDDVTANRIVYKIPVLVGYPADTTVIFHNNNSSQTQNMDLINKESYFWNDGNGGGWHTDNDTKALELLLAAEGLRAGAASSSVCNIDAGDASDLYTEYLGLTPYQKGLVDGSKVWTYSDEEKQSSSFKDVYYSKIMEQIGIIGGNIQNPNSMNNIAFLADSKAIIIITIAASTTLAFTFFLIFRRKKHQ